MPELSRSDTTHLLTECSRGVEKAADQLFVAVYDELRALAWRVMRDPADNSLQPTALVHEAFLRLVDQSCISEIDRAHFLNLAARAMRQILVDHARRRHAAKRGGAWKRTDLGQIMHGSNSVAIDLISLSEALSSLAELEPRQAKIVEMRFLAGMTIHETATALGISARTVALDWRMARAWLRCHLGGEASVE